LQVKPSSFSESSSSSESDSQSPKDTNSLLSVPKPRGATTKPKVAAVRYKQVVCLTPVMIAPLGFSQNYDKKTISYPSNEKLHLDEWPAVSDSVKGGDVIDVTKEPF
jgi:hypothetical protein